MNVKYLSLIALFFSLNLQAMEAGLSAQTEDSEKIKAITDNFNGEIIEKINQELGSLSRPLKRPGLLATLFNQSQSSCKIINITQNAHSDIFSPDGSLWAYIQLSDICGQLTDAPYTVNRVSADMPLSYLQFNPSGTLLATLEGDFSITIWDLSLKNITHAFTPSARVKALCFSRDSRYLASYSMVGDIEIWDLTTNQCIATFNDQDSEHFAAGALAFNHDASVVACANNEKIIVWNIDSKKLISSCPTGDAWDSYIIKLSFLKDTSVLTGIKRNAEIVHLDTAKNIVIPTDYETQNLGNIYSVASNDDGSLLVYVATSDGNHLQILYPETKSYFSLPCKLNMVVKQIGLKTNPFGTSVMTFPRSRYDSILDIDITALLKATQNWDTFLFNKDKYTWEQLFYVRALLAKIADHYKDNKQYTLANSEERVIFRRLPESVQTVLLKELVQKGKPATKSEE